MNNNILQYIINEEYNKFLYEYIKDDDVDWDLYEKRDEKVREILGDFLYDNNPDFTKEISWHVVPYEMLKKVWEDYMRYGFLRSTKPLDKIERIITNNVVKLDVLTEMQGHSPVDPDEEYFKEEFYPIINDYLQYKSQQYIDNRNQLEIDFEKGGGSGVRKQESRINPNQNEMKVFNFFDSIVEKKSLTDPDKIREELYEALKDQFHYYYTEDSKSGQPYLSDYGLEPLQKLVIKLRNTPEDNVSERIITLDKILNVVHPRSDLAALFVKGGSKALSDLSASPSERASEKNDNKTFTTF
jgi:hypothetical protein